MEQENKDDAVTRHADGTGMPIVLQGFGSSPIRKAKRGREIDSEQVARVILGRVEP